MTFCTAVWYSINWAMNWRNDPQTCWTISAIVSYVHLKIFRCLHRDSNPWPQQCVIRKRNDEWKKSLWSVAKRWIEEMILTLARQSQWFPHMCSWNFSGFFNKAFCTVYFTSSLITFSFHSDLILENAKDKDVAFLVVGDPFGWVTSEYHYSMHNGTILTVDIQRYFHLFGSY